MKIIDHAKIEALCGDRHEVTAPELDRILDRSRTLHRLSLEETAALLRVRSPHFVDKILETATQVKKAIYGTRVVLFAPLYVNNICVNACAYCAFQSGNPSLVRKRLEPGEVAEETRRLLTMGHKRVLVVSSESADAAADVDLLTDSIRTIYATREGGHRIRRINVNCAPLPAEGFRRLKEEGIGTYQLFQETYHDATYRDVHPRGPKSDPDLRLDAIERAIAAGIDDFGMGVLYGLYDYRYETLALLSHIEYLEGRYHIGPHTISVPRLEPAGGVDLSRFDRYLVGDAEFKKLVAVLRLSVPYTGMILSTRETPAMRDELFTLGISQISAASNTAPGGYTTRSAQSAQQTQFTLSDHRSLDEVIGALIKRGAIPSFCTACYRTERTGETFMNLARPGTIKGKCRINALITLKEYLDDFASDAVRAAGYRLIEREIAGLPEQEREYLTGLYEQLNRGMRDSYV